MFTKEKILIAKFFLKVYIMSIFVSFSKGYDGIKELHCYIGTVIQMGTQVCLGFLQHFSNTTCYYSKKRHFKEMNNMYVDKVDAAMFMGHGWEYEIEARDGWVNFMSAGYTDQKGFGDTDSEFFFLSFLSHCT